MTHAYSAIVFKPDQEMVVISAWPKPVDWMHEAIDSVIQRIRSIATKYLGFKSGHAFFIKLFL